MAKYKPYWKRNPNVNYSIGTKVNGSTIICIQKPSDESAYMKHWSGHVRYQNPKWYDIQLEDGRWIEIRFDMVSNEWGDNLQLTGECDGCALATLNEEELGEVCIDISPLMWEVGGSPWSH